MNIQELRQCYEELKSIVEEKLFNSKHKEYASEQDALVNFHDASYLTRFDPEVVAWLYATKHYVSIISILENLFIYNQNLLLTNSSLVKEKFTDMIAYLFLIYSIITDKEKNYGN